jgi:hypothetical protein
MSYFENPYVIFGLGFVVSHILTKYLWDRTCGSTGSPGYMMAYTTRKVEDGGTGRCACNSLELNQAPHNYDLRPCGDRPPRIYRILSAMRSR